MRKITLFIALILAAQFALTQQVSHAQARPIVDVGARTLRANQVRAEKVDEVLVGMHFTEPSIRFRPSFEKEVANEKIADLNTVIDNHWLADVATSLTRFLGLRPEGALRLSQSIVDTALAQPAGMSLMNFCANQSGCVNTPITDYELRAMRGYSNYSLTSAMNINRVVPISKPAGVALAAAFAELNPAEAKKRQPLNAAIAAAILPLCETNNIAPDAPDLARCIRAGIGYTLARQGNNR